MPWRSWSMMPRMPAELWIYNQFNDRKTVVPLADSVVFIGREASNHVCLQSPFISRVHAKLMFDADRWCVESLGLNGTMIGEQTLKTGQRYPLRAGEEFRLGEFSLYVVDREHAAAVGERRGPSPARQALEIERAIHAALLERLNLRKFSAASARGNADQIREIRTHLDDLLNHAVGQVDKATARHFVVGYLKRRVMSQVARLSTGRVEGATEYDEPDVLEEKFEAILSQLCRQLIDAFRLRLTPATIKEDLWAIEDGFDGAVAQVLGQFTIGLRDYVVRRTLTKDILDIVLGYGPLQDLLDMPNINDIMVVGADHIYVERNGVVTNSGRSFFSDEVVYSIIERIITPTGRKIDQSTPLVDARLPDGSRVNAVIPPLSLCGPCLTIRKFSRVPFTIDDLTEFGTLNRRTAAFLQACVRGRMNMVITGGTGSGKTTLLNVLAGFCGREERIVTIEDAAELKLPQEHVVSLETRPANIEGRGSYAIRDLVRNALRMRPDRIIVGECRGAEALDMLAAMNTGHDGSLTTLHANTPADAMSRLETMVLMAVDMPVRAIREQIVGALDLVVQVARRPGGGRAVTHICEVRGIDDVTGQIILEDVFVLRSRSGLKETHARDAELVHTGYVPEFAEVLINDGLLGLEAFT